MQKNFVEDQVLVQRYIGGEENALQLLIHKHQQKIFGFIISKVKDEDLANDLFQDTFVKVINTLKSGRYNEEGKFIQWVMRIAHNLVIDHFRRNKRFPTIRPTSEFDIFDVINSPEKNFEESIIYNQILLDAQKLIEYLPEEQKEVIQLRMREDLSFKEIADQTNVSINTALGRMRYALINLRKLIEKHQVVLSE
jgi:RNA polymerase sigma factor (sigma-70 family)